MPTKPKKKHTHTTHKNTHKDTHIGKKKKKSPEINKKREKTEICNWNLFLFYNAEVEHASTKMIHNLSCTSV